MESASKPAAPESVRPAKSRPRISVRVAVFIFIELVTLWLVGPLLQWTGPLIDGAVTTFAAAALANYITLRIYERGQLADIGLAFHSAARRNFLFGFGGGFGAAAIVCLMPVLAGWAKFVPAPEQPANWRSFIFVSIVLLFGAVGEEMLFRGYGFQVVLRRWGAFSTILPMGVVFAYAHSLNPNATPLAMFNTFLWGAIFGLCFLRSGDLWLPIGLHFGWNWTLPLAGVNLSGFTMSVTGHAMDWSGSTEFIRTWVGGGGYGVEGGLLTVAVVPLVCWYLWKAPVTVSRPFLLSDAIDDTEPTTLTSGASPD